jgi:hypothetical protein
MRKFPVPNTGKMTEENASGGAGLTFADSGNVE